jgi:hypothetical protein
MTQTGKAINADKQQKPLFLSAGLQFQPADSALNSWPP